MAENLVNSWILLTPTTQIPTTTISVLRFTCQIGPAGPAPGSEIDTGAPPS